MNIIVCIEDSKSSDIVIEEIETKLKGKIDFQSFSFNSFESVLFHIEEDLDNFDLIILGQKVLDESGLLVANKIRKLGYKNELLFYAENENDVFDSFEVFPISYVLEEKPISYLESALERAIAKSKIRKRESFAFKTKGKKRVIDLKDIKYIEAERHGIVIHYGKEKEKLHESLSKMEELLCGKGFFRIHRGIIVSGRYVKEYSRDGALLISGENLPISAAYYKINKGKIKDYLNKQIGVNHEA